MNEQTCNQPDTLYYDSQCPLCSSEVALLRKLKGEDLRLADIHAEADESSRTRLLKVLHLETSNGEWVTGIDATIRAWSSTRIGWAWKVLDLPLIRPLADRLYDVWARRRYQNLYGE